MNEAPTNKGALLDDHSAAVYANGTSNVTDP